MKKILIILLIIIATMPFSNVYAVPGCCSWHGGEAGCSGGRTLCSDGTISNCPCDGTSSYIDNSSSNNNVNYNGKESVGIFETIFGFIMFIVFLLVVGSIMNIYDKSKTKRNNRRREYQKRKEKEHIVQIQEQKENDFEYIIENIQNEEDVHEFIDNMDEESIYRFRSDDLIEIINSNSDSIFVLLDLINASLNNNPYRHVDGAILSNFCFEILEQKKLNTLQNKCIKYILDNKMINCHKDMFLKMLENNHITLAKYVLNNCNDREFSFDKYYDMKILFNHLLKINDLDLVKKVASKKNFKFDYDIELLTSLYDVNIENKYKIFSILYKNEDYLYISINNIIKESIDFNDENDILNKIIYYSKMNQFLEDNGYYIVYLLIKKRKNDSIEYLLNNFKNINLDKRIDDITPLIYACYRKINKIVKLLLYYGVDVNYGDINGNTALEYACSMGNLNLVKLLYENGARLKKEEDNTYIEEAILKKDSFLLYQTSVVYISKLYKLQNEKN